MIKNILEIVENCPQQIKERFIIKKFEKGAKIVQQGFEAKYFYILLEGMNKIYRTSKLGTNYLQLVIEAQDVYGEIELSNHKPSICTVEALEYSKVIMIPREVYIKWLETDCNFSMFIINKLSDKLYSKIEKASNDVFYNLEYKFIRLVLDLYNKNKNRNIPISKDLIAEELASALRSINRTINKLKQKNILKYENGEIIIIDLEKLKKQEEELLQ